MDFARLWADALPYDRFLDESKDQHKGLWVGVYGLARIPQWAREAVGRSPRLRFLVLTEDWCGDAANTIPILARLVDEVPGPQIRILRRDENPAVMDRYLTGSARSIPIVIVLDDEFRELGHWGPRPAPLQAFVMANRATVPKAELYPQVRKWYARDRGEATLREILAIAANEEHTATGG